MSWFTQLFSGGIDKVISSVGEAADRLVTSDEERLKLRNELALIEAKARLDVVYGTYTPTITTILNISGAPTVNSAFYSRVGNTVQVNIALTVPVTTVSTQTALRASLPIASNFTTVYDLIGTGAENKTTVVTPAYAFSTVSTDDATIVWFTNGSASSEELRISFSYLIK